MAEEYLKHYGVLGMKWGVRRHGDDYRYSSHMTKSLSRKSEHLGNKAERHKLKAKNASRDSVKARHQQKAKMYSQKSNAVSKKAQASQKFDDKMLKSVKRTGGATTALAALTLGTGVTKTYQALKVSGTNPGLAAVGAYVTNYLGGPAGGLLVRHVTQKGYVDRHSK